MGIKSDATVKIQAGARAEIGGLVRECNQLSIGLHRHVKDRSKLPSLRIFKA